MTSQFLNFIIILLNLYLTFSLQTIIDCEIGHVNVVIPCPIDRTKWSFPSILQWYRLNNNYSKPIASQFDNYPVHIDEFYRNKYKLLSNGSLNIENVQLNDNDTYECRLILIDRGLLDVKEKYLITLRVNEHPRFVNLSKSIQIVERHSIVHLICQIYSVPMSIINWYRIREKTKQIVNDKQDFELLSIHSQQLTLYNINDDNAGKYRCTAENRLGSIENDFQILINGSIYWRRYPQSQIVKINETIILQCEGESSEPLQYQWLKNDLPISDTISFQDRIRTYSDGVLSISNIQPSDHGSYVCVISTRNSASVRSKSAMVTVQYPPMPSFHRPTRNLTLIRGSTGICPCLLEAYPPIQSVSWYRNGISIRIQSKGSAYSVNSDYSLIIKSVEIDDDGKYFCRAQNSEGFGQDSLSFYIETQEPIKFHLKPKSIYRINEHDTLTIPCIAFGNPQPKIKWFKDSIELNYFNENLTLENIDKTDYGFYICQASNEHTTTNITTLIIVENTTPQAPQNLRYKQILSNVFLSWEPGYDGGHTQYFIIWYRMLNERKRNWNQIRVLPNNSTEFILFDLKFEQIYELTIVAENDRGLGTFTPIITFQLNHEEIYSNISRPLSPKNIHLSQFGTDLYIKWNHPDTMKSSENISYYVLQWRSTILFNNQHTQQSIVLTYPTDSFLLKDVKQSKYILQLISYSDNGIYSIPIESHISIQYNSLFSYKGSNRLLIILLCILILLTIASIFLCMVCVFKSYYHRRSYCTEIDCDSKCKLCCCLPPIQYKFGDCSHMKIDRYHANLLKSNDLPTTPLYTSVHRMINQMNTDEMRSSSPIENYHDSSTISLAKVTTIPRCRDSITDETKIISRLPLEAVPEMSELDIANNQYTFEPSFPLSSHFHTVQTSPLLITFDSSSLKRHN